VKTDKETPEKSEQHEHSGCDKSRHTLLKENNALLKQRERLRRERDSLVKQRERLRREREASSKQRGRLCRQRDALIAQRDMFRLELGEQKRHNKVIKGELLKASAAHDLFESICNGNSLEISLVRCVRLYGSKRIYRVEMRAFAHALSEQQTTQKIGLLCSSIMAAKERLPLAALAGFKTLPKEYVLQYAPCEYLDVLLGTENNEWRIIANDILNNQQSHNGETLLEVAKILAGRGKWNLSERFVKMAALAGKTLGAQEQAELNWMLEEYGRRGVQNGNDSNISSTSISIGVLDYKMLDYTRTSSNLGDYIQTLAMMTNFLRFQNVKYLSKNSELTSFISKMATQIRPAFVTESPKSTVHLQLINRDSGSAQVFTNPVWTVAFGWFMHPTFRNFFDFPFADGVRPIFISFHINNRSMLTPKVVEYLKQYSPIGCRDWSTVYVLREFGVPAFFSGCITTTLGKLFPDLDTEENREKAAFVDCRPRPGEVSPEEHCVFTHAENNVRENPFLPNLQAAYDVLGKYRQFRRIVSSRLHCYLPCRALGLEVDFRPQNKADVRFEGLLDLNEAEFNKIRIGIEEKLQAVFSKILSSASEEEVYSEWHRVCQQDLKYADEYCTKYSFLKTSISNLKKVCRDLTSSASHFISIQSDSFSAIPVAFACDANLADILPVVLESAWRNTSRRIHFHILTRGLLNKYHQKLKNEFAEFADLSFYPFDVVDYGQSMKMLNHTTVSTMDRLLLPEILPQINKIIYLDVDTVVLADLAELYQINIDSYSLAGKPSNYESWKYLYKLASKAANTLEAEKSWKLRRALSAEYRLQNRAFNAGVLLMNLAKMRRERFTELHLPYIEKWAMNDQDALNLYANKSSWMVLDSKWNSVPSQDDTKNANILHFAGPVKPWQDMHILRKPDFQKYQKQYSIRIAEMEKSG
jgi:lipopolysaccharide biosynthesis glycosyltransferase